MRFIILFLYAFGNIAGAGTCDGKKGWGLLLHGGAGDWNIPEQKKRKIEKLLSDVLLLGQQALTNGRTGVEVVSKAVAALEDSGLLNAGKGAIRNSQGDVELDASLMDGKTLRAGSVASVKTLKNPVLGAGAVMDRTRHVLLVGPGADRFAKDAGLAIVGPEYFVGGERSKSKWGTVGAVARDCNGNLAVATPTGGLSGKMPGRVGDSPIIGAGTYAQNGACAVSATGTGEYFIRIGVAREICLRLEMGDDTVQSISDYVIARVGKLGGDGGVIVLDGNGIPAFAYNTKKLLRGKILEQGDPEVSF